MTDEDKINVLRARLTGLVFACRDVNISDSISNERYKGRFIHAMQEAEALLERLNKPSQLQ